MKKEIALHALALTILLVCNPVKTMSSDLHTAVLKRDIDSISE